MRNNDLDFPRYHFSMPTALKPRNWASAPQWNVSVIWSVMSAIIFSQILVQGQDQAASYNYFSLNGVSVHVNMSAFKFFILSFTGWFHSWVHFHLSTAANPIDDSRRNFVGLSGLCLWFVGQIVYITTYQPPAGTTTIEQLQSHYQYLMYIDMSMITFGGSLFYWSIRTQQFAIFGNPSIQLSSRRLLFFLYTVLPSLCAVIVVAFNAPLSTQVIAFVQSFMYYLIISLGPLTITLLHAVNIIDLDVPGEEETVSTETGGKPTAHLMFLGDIISGRVMLMLSHGIFLVCSTTLFYLPFMHIYSYMVYNNAPPADTTYAILLLLVGGMVGKVLVASVVDFSSGGRAVLPLMSAIQTTFLVVWLATHGTYDLALVSSVGFFLGLSSTSTFVLSHVRSTMDILPRESVFTEPMMNVFHMTCMVVGAALLIIITWNYTNAGSVDYQGFLSVATGLSAGATASSLTALYFSPK